MRIYEVDRDVAEAMQSELERQRKRLELIASENFVMEPILEAQGSVLTNKYAEGYPGRRYYGGCEFIDIVESLAIQRAKELFGAEGANVQPHSGTQANVAVYFATMKPGETLLGMDLNAGGHLSHGSPVSITGKYYNAVHYGVDKDTELIDYNMVEDLAKTYRPRVIIAGASCYPRFIDFEKFQQIAKSVGAYLMVDIAHVAGLIAAKIHPTPVPFSDFVTTTTHKTLRGPRGGLILFKKEHEKIINRSVFPGTQGGPLEHIIAAKAVALKLASTEEFVEYQKQIVKNAKALADALLKRGYRLITGGTDNHLLSVDLRSKNITGKEAETLLDLVDITTNKEAIPFDPLPPTQTSGLRLGTPALTTRGMKEEDMDVIAELIDKAIENRSDEKILLKVKEEVNELTKRFPLYKTLSYLQ
ncbi:MAG: serine hydroxymethyltransferase [Caldiserica bacterium CG02_land_8_20_14_3_00_36_38]|nr:serine hydroxymethyltransferase [Caldisericota bacterium]OIP12731.1 MAG: serine hydroxymethyltransferase [Caldisericum sp. CG2_30_36_11]PIP50080.1 MAG: serine hydroxymethyltransferase [Caldiserica bacterium CG23_combo_of_CG06-09_8_20_14_all_35_60]PIV54981.1 MAG: serine hydroxymethyltransferase [Caldiserica bacterium CG02_land_8_20_14_3_00_36_38]PIW11049.1 MAG: serine hydroxymethyltransferase [Caldiserica bacterium CG17_big_fil_post_rev_8_21_14_2_50_35_7]